MGHGIALPILYGSLTRSCRHRVGPGWKVNPMHTGTLVATIQHPGMREGHVTRYPWPQVTPALKLPTLSFSDATLPAHSSAIELASKQ
jgi:hypothetical protein